jgi:hypothetical protein
LLAAALGSAAVETGKLFIAPLHPDPTNPLIVLGAVAATLALLALVKARGGVSAPVVPARRAVVAAAPPAAGWPWAVVALAGWATLLDAPAFRGPLLAGVAAAAALAAWRPALALAIVPLALPALDLAPWSGRLFWTEFDALLLAVLGAAAWRTPPATAARGALRLGPAFALLGASYLASTLHALWPWPGLDDNSFGSLLSPFNTLRVVKGALWAWAFVALLDRVMAVRSAGGPAARRRGPTAVQALVAGVVAGLAVTVTWGVAERWAFVGLLDLSSDYRVTGPFSAMQRGGAYIECYLAVAAAAALAVVRCRRGAARAGALLLLAGAGWATTVTYSRNGWVAFALVVLGGALLVLWQRARKAPPGAAPAWGGWAWAGAGTAVLAAAVLPVLLGPFAQQRLAQSSDDLGRRLAHWAAAPSLRDPGPLAALVGEGPGRFAERHFWRSREGPRAGSFALRRGADGARLLRLGPGAPVYVEQWLDDAPAGALRLQAEIRAADGLRAPSLDVSLCRKSTLTSVACTNARLAPAPGAVPDAGGWLAVQATLQPPKAHPPARERWLPAKFALHTPAQAPAIDVRRIALVDDAGRAWLRNGDFAAGLDRWFFVTDVDPPWQLHSLPLSVWFELGWLGVAAWALLVVTALAGWAAALRARDAAWPEAGLAALAFLASGLLNTLIDEPRFLALLLVCLALAPRRTGATGGGPAPGRASGGDP